MIALNRIDSVLHYEILKLLRIYIDSRNQKSYPIVKIHHRWWMAEDLIIGDPINIGRYKNAKLSGRVIDGKTGETLVGAVVFNRKMEHGSTTNGNGEFELDLPTGEHQLQISFVGFESAIVKINLIEDGEGEFQIFEKS